MVSMVKIVAEIEVCQDCTMVHANGETGNETPDREPWGEMPPGADVAMYFDSETGEGFDPFSWHDCDACGTTLAGERFRFAVFSWGRIER